MVGYQSIFRSDPSPPIVVLRPLSGRLNGALIGTHDARRTPSCKPANNLHIVMGPVFLHNKASPTPAETRGYTCTQIEDAFRQER